jgi:citrate synthase
MNHHVEYNGKETVELRIGDKTYILPVELGREGEKAIDISHLRAVTGYTTLDVGFGNTTSTRSNITYLDGEAGILRYRGYALEDLAEHASFTEVAYLLIYGELPTAARLDNFEQSIKEHTMLHEDFKRYYDVWPSTAHPMGLLAAAVGGMSAFYDDALDPLNPEHIDLMTLRLLAKLPTMAAYIYKKMVGQPMMYPQDSLNYIENFLYMMYATPTRPFAIDPAITSALNRLLVSPLCLDFRWDFRAVGSAAWRGQPGGSRDAGNHQK